LNFVAMKFVLLILSLTAAAHAQFSTAFFQDEKYWGDGKAEFNFYDAVEMRYGQPRKCEVIHILVREPFAERDLVKAEADTRGGTYPVIKLNQILHIPTGVYAYQQMHSAFWRCDTSALVKATLTSNDSCGNTYKEFRALGGLRGLMTAGWRYEWRTYWEGMSAGEENISAPENAVFYDELPIRVRTIDFAQPRGEFEIQLAPTIIKSKKDQLAFISSKVAWEVRPDDIEVTVTSAENSGTKQRETFILEAKAPHRLREWQRPDGGRLTLRKSLKLDYWNYNQPGDLERALHDAASDVSSTKNSGESADRR
jgi:hypothetical protein